MKNLHVLITVYPMYMSIIIICQNMEVEYYTYAQLLSQSQSNETIRDALSWYQAFPAIGLTLNAPFYPPPYPFIPHYFSLWDLAPHKGSGVNVVFIDTGLIILDDKNRHYYCVCTDQISQSKKELLSPDVLSSNPLLIHGTHNYGIVSCDHQYNGHCIGIAPHAHSIMIKTFKPDGTTTKSALIKALQHARDLGAEVVNLSLKIADTLDLYDSMTHELISVLKHIPYAVAASGNYATVQQAHCVGSREAYPARFSCIPFDVGAFMYQDSSYPIAWFTQYEKNVGPKFVMPGYNILSTTILSNNRSTCYTMLHGTSAASSIMAGFVALLLGEFKSCFTRKQLLKTCYMNCLFLHNTIDWHSKTLLGVLDMRATLFTLHALQHIKQSIKNKKISIDIEKKFDNVLQAVLYIMYEQPAQYKHVAPINADFRNNFVEYITQAQKYNDIFDANKNTFFIPSNLVQALSYLGHTVSAALQKGKRYSKPCAPEYVIQKVHAILNQHELDIFNEFSTEIRNRLLLALGDS